jgi:Flp pilus assembly protein TadG
MRSSRIWRAATADERGAAAVEFALVVPVFMLIVFGMIDFTRAYYTQSAIAAAVREGARTAAVLPDPVNDATQLAKVKSRVSTYVVPFGGQAIPQDSITVELLNDDLSACAGAANTCASVRVTVNNYVFNYFTPLSRVVNGGLTTKTITRRAIFRFERNDASTPPAP